MEDINMSFSKQVMTFFAQRLMEMLHLHGILGDPEMRMLIMSRKKGCPEDGMTSLWSDPE
jgi:hypothetical protein